MATLADVMRDSENLSAAESLYQKSLAGLESSLGSSHPETLRVLYEYSVLRKSQRQEIAARRLAFQLIAGARRTLAPNHPDRVKYQQLLDSLR
jgi:hypothetical protein